jgi:hypothetical protein
VTLPSIWSDERAVLRALAARGGRASEWQLAFDLRTAGEAARLLPAILERLVSLDLVRLPSGGSDQYELTPAGARLAA